MLTLPKKQNHVPFVASLLIPKMEFTRSVQSSWLMSLAKKNCRPLANKPVNLARTNRSPGTSSAQNAARNCTCDAKNVIAGMSFAKRRARPKASFNVDFNDRSNPAVDV